MKKLIILAIAVLMLTACSITYKAVGKYKDESDKFIGTVKANVWGGGTATMESPSTGAVCSGKAVLTKGGISCTGQEGTVTMKCSNDKVFTGSWKATSCTTGYGAGTDNNGKPFEFLFGLTENEAQSFVK